MTLKQQLTLNNLPKYNYNIAKSMRESGYSMSSSVSGTVRKPILKHTSKLFDPEYVKRELVREVKRMKKEKDNTNFSRLFEMKARIAIPELRKQDITTNQAGNIVIIDKQSLTDKPKEIQPVDNTKDIAIPST